MMMAAAVAGASRRMSDVMVAYESPVRKVIGGRSALGPTFSKRIHNGYIGRKNAQRVASVERNPLILWLPDLGSNQGPAD